MGRYKEPGGFNLVSFALLLGLAAAVYSGVMFGPSYLRRWKVQEVLHDAASRWMSNRVASEALASDTRATLSEMVVQKLRALGIEDPQIKIDFVTRGDEVEVSAAYAEVIRHPVINKVTVLRFRPAVKRRYGD